MKYYDFKCLNAEQIESKNINEKTGQKTPMVRLTCVSTDNKRACVVYTLDLNYLKLKDDAILPIVNYKNEKGVYTNELLEKGNKE